MKCPFCFHEDSEVKDSRPSEDGSAIRRRRACVNCGGRFTTFERIVVREIFVVKSNGSRQPFDRDKIAVSIKLASRKRPVSTEKIEEIVSAIVRQVESRGESEVPSKEIGELVMNALANVDHIAYIRYASVYRNFTEAKDFEDFTKGIAQ